jgi:hypothetical protein
MVIPVTISGGKAKLQVIEKADHTFNNLIWEKEVLDYSVEFLKAELHPK